jgi:putative ABC transport system permease protein
VSVIALSPLDLILAAALIFALAGLSALQRLGIVRELLVASARMTVRLLLLGLVLRVLFANAKIGWLALIALVMLLAAGREVLARQERRFRGLWGYGLGTLSMFISSFSIAILALVVLVQPEPWYRPQYAIPLLGMLLGNTMNGIALSLGRLTEMAWDQREVIEQRLMLGHSRSEAISGILRSSMRAGMTPMINAMAAAGIVSLPGMMTGQILAGSPPMEAVKYQLLIMFLIAAGSGFGALAAIGLGSRRMFDARHRLRLDRLRSRSQRSGP